MSDAALVRDAEIIVSRHTDLYSDRNLQFVMYFDPFLGLTFEGTFYEVLSSMGSYNVDKTFHIFGHCNYCLDCLQSCHVKYDREAVVCVVDVLSDVFFGYSR